MNRQKVLEGKNIIVMGFSMTGYSVANFLIKNNANVFLTVKEDLSEDEKAKALAEKGVSIIDNGHPLSLLNNNIDFIVKNPGIPYQVEFIQKAIQKNIPIITDVELASWFIDCQFVGVTGSNGKTTTTKLIYDILEYRKEGDTRLAGNIGVPIIETMQAAKQTDCIVAELSSFQLEGTQKIHPNIAVIINIFEAHLDYHENRENYIKAKLKLIQNLTHEDTLVYNYDQNELNTLIKDNPSKKLPFGINNLDNYLIKNGTYLKDDTIYVKEEPYLKVSDIKIPGKHNIMNVLAAVSVGYLYGIDKNNIVEAIKNYNGMPHRIQFLGNYGDREFYNDSKATNIVATKTALSSFDKPIVYIGGGLDRGNGFDDLVPFFKHVKSAFLYGETKCKLKESLKKAGIKKINLYENLEEATKEAYMFAQKGDVVLFSPSCASWDQFKSYEDRGDLFIELIQDLVKTHPYN